jgi:hypothetical protein
MAKRQKPYKRIIKRADAAKEALRNRRTSPVPDSAPPSRLRPKVDDHQSRIPETTIRHCQRVIAKAEAAKSRKQHPIMKFLKGTTSNSWRGGNPDMARWVLEQAHADQKAAKKAKSE